MTAARPGSVGFAAEVTGGRDPSASILFVTNLNDSGAGSFRAALEATGPRFIVFRVAGDINFQTRVEAKGDVTIEGATAPFQGIRCRGHEIRWANESNVIMRNIKFRLGFPNNFSNQDSARNLTIQIPPGGSANMGGFLIEHCSFSWSLDTSVSVYNSDAEANKGSTPSFWIENVTFRNCLFAEPYENLTGGHSETNHAYNTVVSHGTRNVDFIDCVWQNARQRNPRNLGNRTDFYNCIRVNCIHKSNTGQAGQAGVLVNVNAYNNWLITGADNDDSPIYRINGNSADHDSEPQHQLYINGGGGYNMSSAGDDVWNQTGDTFSASGSPAPTRYKKSTPHTPPALEAEVYSTFSETHATLQANVGAIKPLQDDVDIRLLAEWDTPNTGTWPYSGASGNIIGSDAEKNSIQVYDDLTDSGTAAYTDSNNDGMEDAWATANGVSGSPNGTDLDANRSNIEYFFYTVLDEDPDAPPAENGGGSPETGTAPLLLTAQGVASGPTMDLQAPEGPGTEPNGAIIFMTPATVNGTPVADWMFSIGAAQNGGSRWSFCSSSNDAETDQNSDHTSQVDEVVTFVIPGSNTVTDEADISWAANKITLTWGDGPDAAYLVKAVLIWGDVAVGNTAIALTQDGSQAVTGLSFAPKAVFGLMNETMTGADIRTHLRGGFGFAYYNGSVITQYGIVGRILNNGAATAAPSGQLSDSRICGRAALNGTVDFTIEVTSFVSDGFSFATRDNAGEAGSSVFWIALGGADDDFWLSTIASPASAGVQQYTAPAKRIGSALFLGTGYTAIDTARNNHPEAGVLGFGCGASNGEWSVAVSSEAGAADMNENSVGDSRAMNMLADNGTTGIEFDTFTPMTSGLALTWDQVLSGQIVLTLGIKENPAIGAWRGLVSEGLISTGLIG